MKKGFKAQLYQICRKTSSNLRINVDEDLNHNNLYKNVKIFTENGKLILWLFTLKRLITLAMRDPQELQKQLIQKIIRNK